MATFNEIKINEEFIYNEQTWIKVKPVKKGSSCCGKVVYNAYVVADKTQQRVFKPGEQVTQI